MQTVLQVPVDVVVAGDADHSVRLRPDDGRGVVEELRRLGVLRGLPAARDVADEQDAVHLAEVGGHPPEVADHQLADRTFDVQPLRTAVPHCREVDVGDVEQTEHAPTVLATSDRDRRYAGAAWRERAPQKLSAAAPSVGA